MKTSFSINIFLSLYSSSVMIFLFLLVFYEKNLFQFMIIHQLFRIILIRNLIPILKLESDSSFKNKKSDIKSDINVL